MGVEEGQEAALEKACGDGMGDLAVVLEDSPQGRCPSASGASLEEGIERSRAREAADLRFLEGRFEVLLGEDCGRVEQRARGRGDRDALHDRDLVGLSTASWYCTPGRVPRWRATVTS